MSLFLKDARYGLRGLVRAPGYAVAALVSLAIGIGATTTVFSIVNGLLLRPLPYQDSDRLVILWNRSPGLGITEDWFSTAQYFDIKTSHQGLEEVALAFGGNENMSGSGEPERVGTVHVSSNLLPMLGARAKLGRLFVAAEDVKGSTGTAVLSYGMWARRFGADPQAIGRSLTMDGKPYQVVGVLPADFSLPREVMPTLYGAEQAEILLPLPLDAGAAENRDHEDYNIIGKLRPGVSAAQAQAEMEAITARLRRDHPANYPPNGGLTFSIVPLMEQVVGDSRRTLLILMCTVACVLLIACANAANLQLSRALARHREIGVRIAVGATAARIVRQVLTECMVLSLGGAAAGVGLTLVSLQAVRVLGTGSVPRLEAIGVDGGVLLFAVLVAAAAATIFGVIPALRLARLDPQSTLQEGARGSAGASALWGRGGNLRKALVIGELAFSMFLLLGAMLLIRSFARLEGVAPGFNSKQVLTLELTMNGTRYRDSQFVAAAYRELSERLEVLPGVTAAGAITSLPLSQMYAWGPITVEGRVPPPGEKFINADERMVSGHYFEAMEIPLVAGRLFSDSDSKENQPAAIVDEYMARQLWPNESPLGKRFHPGGAEDKAHWITVVGVVGRVKQYSLDSESRIALYLPHAQHPVRAMNVVVRSKTEPAQLASTVRREIASFDSELPVFHLRTMAERVQESLARRRFSMVMLSAFASLAAALATIGIYGVVGYLVKQGTREIGIRMALGATPQSIVRLVVRHGLALAIPGVVIGLAGGLAFGRILGSLLFGVSATDPVTFTLVPLLLTLVAALACYVPARRGARVDPTVSLRSE